MKRLKQPIKKTMLFVLFVLFVLFILSFFPIIENFSFPFLSQPHLTDGDKIYIKSQNNEYITSCPNCLPLDANISNRCTNTLCMKDVPYMSSQFTYRPHRDGTFSLETIDGKYLKRCAECVPMCPHTICSDGINPNLQTHKFVLIKNMDGTISIKTDNGRLFEITECKQTCGKIITALGLNISNDFVIEKVQEIAKSSNEQPVDFSKRIPKEFPAQWPFSQH